MLHYSPGDGVRGETEGKVTPTSATSGGGVGKRLPCLKTAVDRTVDGGHR